MKILILGGNRFFGKKLAQRLISLGHNVTLLNRGSLDDGLGDKVKRIKCDRSDIKAFRGALSGMSWDVVYDQICYDYDTAKESCEVFQGKVNKYIYTSSQSVYETGENLRESDFNPTEHKFTKKETKESNYAEAKRQAEVGFVRHAKFPVTYVRFPIVIGDDDYTNRFKFHVDRIKNNEPIYFPNINSKISFVTSDFAAEVLAHFAVSDFSGPINVASPEPIGLKNFINIIERSINKSMVVAVTESEEVHSPYGISNDWYMNCDSLQNMGIIGSEIKDWLPNLLS